MKIDRAVIMIGAFFGIIAFVVCLFFFPPLLALLFGVFTAAIYIVVLGIVVNRAAKKHAGDDNIIGREILFKANANYYQRIGVCNGMLYLTADSVIFISHEKKPALIEEIPLDLIKHISFGTRHIAGLQIITDNGTERQFIGANVREFAEMVREQRDTAYRMFKHIKSNLNCYCWVVNSIDDVSGAMEDYERLLAQWKPEGFMPLIILPSELLCETIDEALPKSEIIESSGAINAAELLSKRIKDAMPCGEDADYDIMGEFADSEPVTVFHSLIGSGESDSDSDTTNPYEAVIFAKIPVANPWELAAWVPMGGFNECPMPEEQVAVFKYWHEKYGAIPAVVSGDTWELYVERPPTTQEEAAALAMEQFGFCSDIVTQGVEKINALASTLVNSKAWYFWWD